MIKLPRKTLIGWVLLLAALWTGTPLSSALAEPRFSSACLIESTPFYHRLLRAGVFEEVSQNPILEQQKPLDLLFRIAKSFEYKSDKSKGDRWQTAEETSKGYQGDCEDKAIWLYVQMQKNGYRNVSLVIGQYGPRSRQFHTWVTYTNDSGETLLLDPTIQKKPWNINAFAKKLYRPIHIISGQYCVTL